MVYKLSVGALFKNEAHSIVEWIEHYLFHGVEHFYLIDDSSTDNSCELIQKYINKNIITLFQPNNWEYYLGRQRDMYNRYILPLTKESDWLIMCDLDEYIWSPQGINLANLLECFAWCSQIQFNNTVFGSNGLIDQPKYIVPSFTKRSELRPTIGIDLCGDLKYIINCKFNFISLNVHHATYENKADSIETFKILDYPYFVMNHYSCQSLQFWKEIKCTRGDSDNYRERKLGEFFICDLNEVVDAELFQQNALMYENLNK